MSALVVIHDDLDGDLVRLAGAGHAKRLAPGVAWHAEWPEALAEGLDALVARVELPSGTGRLVITYHPHVKPLPATDLLRLLRPAEPLAAWRLAHLAVELSDWLSRCHDAGFPQMVVHPGRLGLLDGRFVLLPTLSVVLPRFPDLVNARAAGWLSYVAPEVLRTRAIKVDLLPAGDVYALGRLLHRLAAGDVAYSAVFSLDDVERIVERPAPLPPLPPEYSEIAPLLADMCAILPERRPPAADLSMAFRELVRKSDPAEQLQSLITARKIPQAQTLLTSLERSLDEGLFPLPAANLHTLRADAALAQTPPDNQAAIDQLERAKQHEPKNPNIFQRIGRVYTGFTGHPQHLVLAGLAYQRAAELSAWRADIVDEWMETLRLAPPADVLAQTARIPWNRRQPTVYARRTAAHLAAGDAWSAWIEAVEYFSHFGFDAGMFTLAQQAGQATGPVRLIHWMNERRDIDSLPAVQAIVWQLNGRQEKAAAYYAAALGRTNREG